MTNIQRKPNGWNEPLNQMTDDEWKEYFRLRDELDVEYTEEEISELLEQASAITEFNEQKKSLLKKLPIVPAIAYATKLSSGLKELMHSNLSLAKKEYPDEF